MTRTNKIYKFLFYFWLILIWIVSSIPDIGSPNDTLAGFDKYAHFGQYLILAVLYLLMKYSQNSKVKVEQYFFISIILTFLEEGHQLWIRGRDFSLLDFACNWAGVTTAFLIYAAIIYHRSRQKTKL